MNQGAMLFVVLLSVEVRTVVSATSTPAGSTSRNGRRGDKQAGQASRGG